MSLELTVKKLEEASRNLLKVLNQITTEDFALGKDREARETLSRIVDQAGLAHTRKPRIIVKLEGGLPQEVGSDKPVDLIILDYDTEGCDEDDLIEVDGEQCFLHDYYGLGNEKDWVDRNWVEEE